MPETSPSTFAQGKLTTCENLDEWMGILYGRLKKLESTVLAQDDIIKKQAEEIKNLKAAKPTIITDSWTTIASKNVKKPAEQIAVINTFSIELADKKKREKNLIVFGVPISKKKDEKLQNEDDLLKIKDIFNSMEYSVKHDNLDEMISDDNDDNDTLENRFGIKFIRRLKPKTGDTRPPPIIVEIVDANEKKTILSYSRKLRSDSNFKNVYINPDMTEAERKLDYDLRMRRNDLNKHLPADSPFRFGIRGNEVTKIRKQLH